MSTKKSRADYVIRDGGDTVPAIGVMVNWLLMQAAMATSDEPRLRVAARKALMRVAADLLAHRFRTARVSAAMIEANKRRARLPEQEELEALLANAKTPAGKPIPKGVAKVMLAKKRKVTVRAVDQRLKKKTEGA